MQSAWQDVLIVFRARGVVVACPHLVPLCRGLSPSCAQNEEGLTIEVSNDFLLSDSEISVELFKQFINDGDYDGEKPTDWEWGGYQEQVSPMSEHPIQSVNWNDAVMFCNWLSRKEGRQVCYAREGKSSEKSGDGFWSWLFSGATELSDDSDLHWQLVEGTDGYRLPTADQSEYACRAGTTTLFSFGSEEDWLEAYSVHKADRAEPCGNKLPNGWGLFDTHGNVGEWCYDLEDVVFRVYRCGSWSRTAGACGSSSRVWRVPSDRRSDLGFRVAVVPSSQTSSGGGAENSEHAHYM